ncbi:hypothetical protein [Arsenicicoccus bolidensis]|uniref:hypothetical protein n=1 Tax=Arsenicicoccus bolidensis TaxID=229480 RepID=UPI000411742F|nr:hypothetical protein [Arsenicicoccus bolidensis]
MGALPRRTLADWHPALEMPLEVWLDDLGQQGWRPEYTHGGVEVTINGRRVVRYALIEHDPADLALTEPGV